MAVPLVSDIVDATIIELAQVPGLNTQVYATPRILRFVEDATVMLVDSEWWPQLRKFFYNVATDPLTGLLINDLVADLANHEIVHYEDIENVFPSTSSRPLRGLPSNLNPALIVNNTTNAIYMLPDLTVEKRPFKILPVTATDTYTVVARQRPVIPQSSSDKVYLDRQLLIFAAAYMYAEDDGTNPGSIAKFKGMFEARKMQVMNSWQKHRVPLDSRFGMSEYEWTEVP